MTAWGNSIVRTAYLKNGDASTPIKHIRDVGIQRVVSYPRQRAIVFRALPAQIAAAEPLLR